MKTIRRLLAAIFVLAIPTGCGGSDDKPAKTSQSSTGDSCRDRTVSGSGYAIPRPMGFKGDGPAAGGSAVETTLLAQGSSPAFPANITVARTPAPPGGSVSDAVEAFRQQLRAQGAGRIEQLDDRKVDGDQAVGFASSRRGPGGAKLAQRSYSAVHNQALYTIGLTAAAPESDKYLPAYDLVLRCWRWK